MLQWEGRQVVRAILLGILVSAAAAAEPLTLDQAVKLGLDRNPDLRKQVLLALSAEQDKVLARASILPKLDFNASAGGTRQGSGTVLLQGIPFSQPTSTYSTGSVGLTLRQLVFDGGKWWNSLAGADLNLASNRAQVDEQRLQITYLIEQRFYELVRAQRQLQVLSEAAQRSRDQADFTQRLYDGGRATLADVYAARANRDNDEIMRLGQERTVELARADLAVAIGLDPSEPLAGAEQQRLLDDPAEAPAGGEAGQR